MVKTEYYDTRSDGVKLYRTYSTTGKYIERDGARYSEAIDPEGADRTYTESDEDIEEPSEDEYATIGRILMGEGE